MEAGAAAGSRAGRQCAQRAGAVPASARSGRTAVGGGLRPRVPPQQPGGWRRRSEADVCLDGQAWMPSPHTCFLSTSCGSTSLC